MTASLEEYLKTIYMLIKENNVARVTDIAEKLNCSKPSVNRALKILKNEGFILYEAYGDITLSENGVNVSKDIIRKHNTLKAFLIEALKVDDLKAEEEAKLMKHAISEDTVNRLEKYIEKIIDVDKFVCNYNPNNEKCRSCKKHNLGL